MGGRPPGARRAGWCWWVGQVADELLDRVGGQVEVGFEDPRAPAGLAVHRSGEPHHPAAVAAREVGDVRLAVAVDAEVVDQPQVRALDRLKGLAGLSIDPGGGERLVKTPVGMDAAAPRRRHQQMTRPLGEERPEVVKLSGLVDVDPQRLGVGDRPLVAAGRVADSGGDEHLLAAAGAPRGEREQPSQPAGASGGPAGQEVICPGTGVDRQRPVAPGAGGELDQSCRAAVQDAELQCPVALGRKLGADHAAVGELYPAAQSPIV